MSWKRDMPDENPNAMLMNAPHRGRWRHSWAKPFAAECARGWP